MKTNLSYIVSIIVVTLLLSSCTAYDFDQPNTPANQAGFERHFGFPVPDTVSELYYYADELGADVKYQLGFRTDQETIQSIVSELELVQRETEFQLGLAQEFDWWDIAVVEKMTPYWKSNAESDYYWYLWYDPESESAYYLEFSL